MYGRYFYYNGKYSSDYGIIINGFNSNGEEIQLGMSREIQHGTLNRSRMTANFTGANYSDVLTFTIQIMKDTCENDNQNDLIFTEDEVDEIVSWITEPEYPTLFHMYDDDEINFRTLDYFAVCSDVQSQAMGDRIYGFEMTFVTNSPYAWTEERKATFEIPNHDSKKIDIYIRSSERNRPVYPIIEFNPSNATSGSGEKIFRVSNDEYANNDLFIMKFTQLKKYIIDCENGIIARCSIDNSGNIISTEYPLYDDDITVGEEQDDGTIDVRWPQLYNGENTLWLYFYGCEGTVTIKYREPRKVGEY